MLHTNSASASKIIHSLPIIYSYTTRRGIMASHAVFANEDLISQILRFVHTRPSLRLTAVSRTCLIWKRAVGRLLSTFHTPVRLEKASQFFKKRLKWPAAVASLPDGRIAVLGQSSVPVLVFIYDTADQPETVVHLNGTPLRPSMVKGMALAASTAEQGGDSLYVLCGKVDHVGGSDYTPPNSVHEFDFSTGAHQRSFLFNTTTVYGYRGEAVDLEAADGHLYVGFSEGVACIDLADSSKSPFWFGIIDGIYKPEEDPWDDPFYVAPLQPPRRVLVRGTGIQSIAIHEDKLIVFQGTQGHGVQYGDRQRIDVYDRHDARLIRSFGTMSRPTYHAALGRPGDFGENVRIRCVAGCLVVNESVRTSWPNQAAVMGMRIQLLALTGEPLCVLTEHSPMLPSRRLGVSNRFPLGGHTHLCAGRGANANRLFVSTSSHVSNVWSLSITART